MKIRPVDKEAWRAVTTATAELVLARAAKVRMAQARQEADRQLHEATVRVLKAEEAVNGAMRQAVNAAGVEAAQEGSLT